MKNKWKRRRRPRPSKEPIRGNSRQMWKAQLQNMLSEEEETSHGTGYGVSAPCAGGHSRTLAAWMAGVPAEGSGRQRCGGSFEHLPVSDSPGSLLWQAGCRHSGRSGKLGGSGGRKSAGAAGGPHLCGENQAKNLPAKMYVPAPSISLDAGRPGLSCGTAGWYNGHPGNQDHQL